MTAMGTPTPNPIFAPVEMPPGRGEWVVVGEFVDDAVTDASEIELGAGVVVIADALASNAESERCHRIGIPSPIAFVDLH